MSFTIRQANTSDVAALMLVGTATFLETYTEILPGTDMVQHCAVHHACEKYAAWLADPECVVWIAQARLGAPIGYLVLIPATLPLEGPAPGDLEVLRIYVLAPYHKDGVGYRLMQLAIEEARGRGAGRLVLGMHNDNVRAMAFYRRQGFEVIGAREFVVGDTICSDSVFALSVTVGVSVLM
jgi:ribosomal protein S18 acetylase RimI-like enzyme